MNLTHFLPVDMPLSPPLQAWLEKTISTTEALKTLTGDATIHVLQQSIRPHTWWDEYALHLHGDVFCREIMMRSHNKACWYARTLVAQNTYQAHQAFFEKLNTQYLGQIIYNQPEIVRTTLQHYSIDRRTIEYAWVKHLDPTLADPLPVRASTFQFTDNQQKLYLFEIILPELIELLHET